MNIKLLIPAFSISLLLSTAWFQSQAQDGKIKQDSSVQTGEKMKADHNSNFIKLNLSAIPFNNYSLQYEISLNRKFSLALSFRTMPYPALPLKSTVLKMVNSDDNTKQTIEDFRVSNFAVTPEIRLYLSKKGYGHGFYFAPFYRYAGFKTNDIHVFYNDSAGTQNTIRLTGKLTSNTGGLLLGIQHTLGRHIVLDIQLLGPHFGTATANFNGTPAKALTTDEQSQVRSRLDIDVPLITRTINVTANNASLKLTGRWVGVRSGICLGVKF